MTPSLLKERVTNSCLIEVSESFIPDDFIMTSFGGNNWNDIDCNFFSLMPPLEDIKSICLNILNFSWPYYSPVLCPALLWPDNVSSWRHKGVGVTDIVLGWVIDRHHTWIILSNIYRDYKNTTDNYSLKNDDMNSWPHPFLKVCHSFLRVRNDEFYPTPSPLFAQCHPFYRFFFLRSSLIQPNCNLSNLS